MSACPTSTAAKPCASCAKNGFKAPIIMLTGHGTDSDTILGLESGANNYITKPFRFAALKTPRASRRAELYQG
jgi:DNA-binding response OmpR family regulator